MTDLSESPEVIETSTVIDNEPAAEIGSRREEITKALEAKEATSETPEAKANRDEKGKFTAKVEKPAEAAPVVEAPKRAYPKSWKRGMEKDFDAIPESVYSEVQRREQDIENGFKRIEQIKQFHDEINQVITPYMPTINALGVKPAQAIQQLLNADHILRTSAPEARQQYFVKLAKNYGVTLDNLPKEENPQYSQLTDEVSQLKQQLQSYQQQSQNAAFTPYINEVNQFASDPAHEHYQELRPIMAALIESGQAADLKTAYEQALWTRPDLRDRQLSEQRKSWQEEEKARIEQAKKAAVSVKGAPSTAPSTQSINDRRSAIEAAMNARNR